MKVSIIIVSYNAPYHLKLCLDSCLNALKEVVGEIIVVDNNSTDRSIEQFKNEYPEVNFIFNSENLGFAKANNLGVDKAQGEYVLILNPDTFLPENYFTEVLSFYESKTNIGFLGVRLIDATGKFHPESKRNIPTAHNSFSKLFTRVTSSKKNNYYKIEVDEYATARTEILVGCCMFSSKYMYQYLGGFDPCYFMYGEDIDLSFSAERAGYRNYYKGDVTVLHYKGESTKRDKKYYKVFFEAMKIFLNKYYKKNRVEYTILLVGIKLKYGISMMSHMLKNKMQTPQFFPLKNELYWLNSSSELNNLLNKHIVLSTTNFTYQEILAILNQDNSSKKSFYIHVNQQDFVIGDQGIITII